MSLPAAVEGFGSGAIDWPGRRSKRVPACRTGEDDERGSDERIVFPGP